MQKQWYALFQNLQNDLDNIPTDVDVKVDALTKLQVEFESGIEVCLFLAPWNEFLPFFHRSMTLTASSTSSKYVYELRTNTLRLRHYLFCHLYFRFSYPQYPIFNLTMVFRLCHHLRPPQAPV